MLFICIRRQKVEAASTVIARLPCLSALEAIRLRNWANDHCEKTAFGCALLLTGVLALLTEGSLTNIGELFQSDQAAWKPLGDAFGNDMLGVLYQPSLLSRDRHQATRC